MEIQRTLWNMDATEVENIPFMIFDLDQACYALEVRVVGDIIFLPELTAMEEVPGFIIGAFNLRGKIVPVIDLEIRFGYAPRRFKLSDSIIVIDLDGMHLGIIVSKVQEVRTVSIQSIETRHSFGLPVSPDSSFLKAKIKIDDQIISVLDQNSLIQHSRLGEEPIAQVSDITKKRGRFCPEATPEEREIFHNRAVELAQPIEVQESSGFLQLTVFRLGGEYFAVDLSLVREFSELGVVTPIPCCPDYIYGDMNLRGDILTLVDIRGILNIPVSPTNKLKMSIVFEINNQIIGIPVDDILDVISPQQSEMTSVPEAARLFNEEFIKGAAPYKDKTTIILDIGKLLTRDDLVINEEI